MAERDTEAGGLAQTMRAFLAMESAGGVLLVAMMAVALAWANSPLAPAYHHLFAREWAGLSLLHWINDG